MNMEETKGKEIDKLFAYMAKNNASDLHLKNGHKPVLRIATAMYDVGNKDLSADEVKKLIYGIMTQDQISKFEIRGDIDFAYTLEGVGRFRINVFKDRGNNAVSIRRVNNYIPTYDELNLPDSLRRLEDMDRGLVIVSGPTGSGKSTTLAAVLEAINKTKKLHLITIEDPIEYMFQSQKAVISQREVGLDVESYLSALKYVVRQDPDVIFIGELRDIDSFEAAVSCAQTGHLVFTTVHASSAAQAIGRLLDLFPPDRQAVVRQGLSFNLRAVLCQKLIPSCKEGVKVVPAVEILFVTSIVQNMIAAGEDKKVADVIRGAAEEGMQDFNQALLKLVNTGFITKKEAILNSQNPEQLKMNMQGIFLEDKRIIS